MAARYDVAVLADLRFPGGTSAALAEELKAAAAGGYRTAILPLKGPVLRRPHPMHPEIAALIAAGSAELVDPVEEVECGLLLVHHPQLLTHAPQAPLRLRAAERLIVAHHPPFDAEGVPVLRLAPHPRHRRRGAGWGGSLGAGGAHGAGPARTAAGRSAAHGGGLGQRARPRAMAGPAAGFRGATLRDRPPQPAGSAEMAGRP